MSAVATGHGPHVAVDLDTPRSPAARAARTLRFLGRAWWLEIEQLMRSRLYLVVSVVFPLIFAAVANVMFEQSTRASTPMALALTTGLMGMWSATLLGSGNTITRLRRMAVLEQLVASPTPTFLFTVPFAVASASLGVYSLVATVGWSALVFDMPVTFDQPVVFAIAIPTTVVSLGLLGLVFSSSYILFPAASSLANLFEYPVWMLSGMLVPVDELAPPLQYVSYVLAPTWGVRAVLVSGAGVEGLGSAAESIAMCLLLCAVYVVIAVVLLHRFERLARSSGTLPLQ